MELVNNKELYNAESNEFGGVGACIISCGAFCLIDMGVGAVVGSFGSML